MRPGAPLAQLVDEALHSAPIGRKSRVVSSNLCFNASHRSGVRRLAAALFSVRL
jgi:hypothetical protein